MPVHDTVNFMGNNTRIEFRTDKKLKDDFNKYCHFHNSTITEQLEQFMRLCVQFNERMLKHAKRTPNT